MTVDSEVINRAARRRVDLLLDLWAAVPVVIVTWPILTAAGYPFSRDLVFTPRLPLRPEALGLGTGSPRAAPLDAVVGALSTVVDGALLGRILIIGVLLVAGCGAHRAVRGLPFIARAVVAALAVWNPFVLERLGLGQWALLAGYAALFPLLTAITDPDKTAKARRKAAAPWLLLGALTPTGALLVGVSAIVVGVRRRADAGLFALAVAVQLPWVLPSILATSATVSDPDGVAAFAARAERAGPAMWSLMGLGGIWDAQSVPGSREGWLGHLTSAVVLTALIVSARTSARPPVLAPSVWVLGLGSLALAGATSIGPLAPLVTQLMGVVPGLGLLRDSQKWLAPFVVLAVLATGVLVDLAHRRVTVHLPVLAPTMVVLAVALPFLLLPDGSVVVHRVLTPTQYPSEVREIERALASEPDGMQAALASLPWRLYRQYPWAGPYATYDPSSRLFDVRVITSDELVVGDTVVRGEDPWAARIGALLRAPGPQTVDELGREGVRWLLVHRDDRETDLLLTEVTNHVAAETVVDGTSMVLVRLSSTDVAAAERRAPSRALVAFVLLVDVAVLLTVLLVAVPGTSTWVRPRSVTLW